MAYSPLFRGNAAKGASRQIKSGYQNGTVGTLAALTPISMSSSGNVLVTDISDINSALAMVGVYAQSVPSGAIGTAVEFGRIEGITTFFALNDTIYVGPSGNLVNVKPDLTTPGFVVGDFIILVGVIVANEFTPGFLDLRVGIQVMGQL